MLADWEEDEHICDGLHSTIVEPEHIKVTIFIVVEG